MATTARCNTTHGGKGTVRGLADIMISTSLTTDGRGSASLLEGTRSGRLSVATRSREANFLTIEHPDDIATDVTVQYG